jgi:acetyl esterase/lipase
VAAAVGWVLDHEEDLGVDGDRLALMGHSAGGHLVAIVAADPDLLAAHGHDRTDIDCVVALDGAGYDLGARASDLGGRSVPLVVSTFGTDPAEWAAASPTQVIVAEGGPVADFLVVTRGDAARQAIAADLVDAVAGAGASAELLVARGYSHGEVNEAVGAPGETLETPAIEGFLDECLAGS